MRLTTTLADAWRQFARRRDEDYSHRRTMMAVSELPPHLLKDIGWPASYESRRGRR